MRIVDLHHYRGPHIYAGRSLRFHRELGALKASPVANPFALRPKQPVVDCLKLYREWLFEQIKQAEPKIMFLLRHINADTILSCWCCEKVDDQIFNDPEVCHCQIVFRAARWLKGKTT